MRALESSPEWVKRVFSAPIQPVKIEEFNDNHGEDGRFTGEGDSSGAKHVSSVKPKVGARFQTSKGMVPNNNEVKIMQNEDGTFSPHLHVDGKPIQRASTKSFKTQKGAEKYAEKKLINLPYTMSASERNA